MAFVRLLRAAAAATRRSASCIVPIVPDEARTFGMEALFRQFGIYSQPGPALRAGRLATSLLYYREAKDGQILEEGITEAGSMASFIAAGTAYADARRDHDPVLHLLLDVRLPADRRPDLGGRRHARPAASCWAARPGRTTLAGEGLQHQDGHSHLLASTVPTCAPTTRPSPTRWR